MIAALRAADPQLSVRRRCQLVGAGRTWYYTWPSPEEVAARDAAWRDAIERLVLDLPGYGNRRVTTALQRDGWTVNHKRALRVMRQESLLCRRKRRFVATTDSAHECRANPNLLADAVLTAPNHAWVAQNTDSRLPTTFVYLACLLDAYSRRCVGWHLSRAIDTRLTLAALDRARALRQPAPGLLHHSDRGVQYASAECDARLERAGARLGMSATGNL